MGPRTGVDGREISSAPGSDPGPSSPYSVAISTRATPTHKNITEKCKNMLHIWGLGLFLDHRAPVIGTGSPLPLSPLLVTVRSRYFALCFSSCGSFPRSVQCRNVSCILNTQERNGVIYQRAFCSTSPHSTRTAAMALRSREYRLREMSSSELCSCWRVPSDA